MTEIIDTDEDGVPQPLRMRGHALVLGDTEVALLPTTAVTTVEPRRTVRWALMTTSLPAASVEHVQFGVKAFGDPTSGTVSIATGETEPSGNWVEGEWAGTAIAEVGDELTTVYVAQFLFGDGDLELDVGEHTLWIRIDDGPEAILRQVPETLTVT
jgi:hypothetical protein